MEYKVNNSYGGFSLKGGQTKLHYNDIKNSVITTSEGVKGYIRVVGTNIVVEHGYSAEEDIYKIITLDYQVLDLPEKIYVESECQMSRLPKKGELDEDELWREDFKAN